MKSMSPTMAWESWVLEGQENVNKFDSFGDSVFLPF